MTTTTPPSSSSSSSASAVVPVRLVSSVAVIGRDNEPMYLRGNLYVDSCRSRFHHPPPPPPPPSSSPDKSRKENDGGGGGDNKTSSSVSPSRTGLFGRIRGAVGGGTGRNDDDRNINNDDDDDEGKEDDDPFGFFATANNRNDDDDDDNNPSSSSSSSDYDDDAATKMSLTEQLVLHASLDRFEEMACKSNYVIGGTSGSGISNASSSSSRGGGGGSVRWRTPGSNAPNVMWMGNLIEVEERWNVYGYLTNTGIKFMLLVEDVRLNPADGTRDDSASSFHPSSPSSSSYNNNGGINRESDLKKIFARLHELYVQHTMNPFSQLRSPIRSRRFDDGIVEMARSYNDAALERVTSSLEGEYGGGGMAKKDGLAWM